MNSILPFSHIYLDQTPSDSQFPKALRTSLYAQGKDYHLWFREKLRTLQNKLETAFPNESFLSFTDSVPILERDFAHQGGLGWVGKNSCLIHPKRGSLFFIGEILSSIEALPPPTPIRNFCGNCNQCVDLCPTKALLGDGTLDANKCIAYWNIEAKTTAPEPIREKLSDWFFGCDICQTVCPWNIKWHGSNPQFKDSVRKTSLETQSNGSGSQSPQELTPEVVEELRWVLTTSNKAIGKTLKDSALLRAGGRGLKRNALLVIGNRRWKLLTPEVSQFVDHPRLSELARWAMERLS